MAESEYEFFGVQTSSGRAGAMASRLSATYRRIRLFLSLVWRISDRHPDGSHERMSARLAWEVAGIIHPGRNDNER